MALILADRVRETSTTTGTGALSLAGAVVGYQTFSSAIGNANTCYYAISNPGVAEWEVGIGTYATSGNTLTRTTIIKSSNSNAAVNFSAGTKDVFVTYPATKSVYLDASGNASALGTPASGTVTNLTGTASININGTVGATTPAAGAFTTGTFSSTLGVTGVATLGNGAVLGTPASGTVTNLTGTASININGTVGATTPAAGAFTTLSATNGLTVTKSGNTAASITQTGATGYGLLIIPGADTVYDALGINNAANTLNQIRMYGNGTATFAGGVGIGGAASPGSTGLAVTGTLSATTDAYFATSSGKVGIGTTSPSFAQGNGGLHIGGVSSPAIRLSSSTGGSGTWEIYADSSSLGGLGFYERQNSQTLMYIDEGGNVGIGTITPASVLNVVAQSDTAGGAGITLGNSAGNRKWLTRFGTNSDLGYYLDFYDGAAWANRLALTYTGNVGIGTTSPAVKLHVYSTASDGANMRLQSTGGSIVAKMINNDNGYKAWVGNDGTNDQWAVGQWGLTGANLGFYTGSGLTERMRIDSSGNVGIGTSSPSAKLHSYATSGTTTTLGRFEAAIGSYTGTSLIAANTLGASSTYNLFSCITDSDGDAGGPFTQFLVCGDGNVGIGTSSPSSKLHVVSSSGENKIISEATAASQQASMSLIVQAATPGQTVIYMGKTGAATNGQLGYDPNTDAMTMFTNNAERMRINSSGNVGIGTSSPSTRLDVVGASAASAAVIKPQGSLPDNNDNAGLYVLHQGTGGAAFRVRTDNAVSASYFAHILVNNASAACTALRVDQYGTSTIADFTKSGTVAMRIDSNGNVGIGTTSPASQASILQVSSGSSASAALSTQGLRLTDNGGNARSIGMYDSNATLGFANGTNIAFLTAGGSWQNSSDRNLKENFIALDKQTALNKIAELPIMQWNYKIEPATSLHIGPIAQDFYAAFGVGGINGETSISTIDPAGVALLGIQALIEKVDAQAIIITALTSRIAALEAKA